MAEPAIILLVDDDASAIRLMHGMLADLADIRFATHGADALRQIALARPDLIVLDADMPGQSGFDVCAALRSQPELSTIPIVMATALAPETAELLAFQHGVTDYLTKPLVRETFRARILSHLAPRAQDSGRPSPALGTARILVVDDDVAAVRVLGTAIRPLGTVQFTTDPHAALDLARKVLPDLVILDAQMPGMNGFELCRQLKAEPTLRHVPVVFVTRFGDPASEVEALAAGAADFVSKPYAPAVLRARLRNLLELKSRVDADMQALSAHWRRLADARVAEAVRTASDAILSLDADQVVNLANEAAGRLFGRAEAHLVGQDLSALMAGEEGWFERAQQSPTRAVARRAEGQTVAVEVSASHFGTGASRQTTLVVRDISTRLRLEAEISAREAAEAANREKSRMIGVVAHEMGQPLNALLGYAQLVQLAQPDARDDRMSLWVGQIGVAASTLNRLREDLIEFARWGSGAVTVAAQTIDVGAVVKETVASLDDQIRAAELTVAIDAPHLAAVADPGRLRQCLTNLLTNAIKYNRVRGHVDVQVASTGDQIAVKVSDTGIGMDAQQRQHLFEPFNRLGRENGDTHGTGLGLYLTRELARRMGGDLQVDSTAGVGSTFSLSLPAAGGGIARAPALRAG